jgi:hypothetical protein
MAKKAIPLLFIGLFVFISACQAEPAQQSTSTNTPSIQLKATETLWPTITAALTATPIPPTATIEPLGIMQANYNNPQIKYNESFENIQSWSMWNEESVQLENDEIIITGQPDWNSALVFNKPIKENQGILLTYKAKYNLDSKAEIVFVSGEYQTEDFRQFGFYIGPTPKANLYQGHNGIGFTYLNGNYGIRKDTWQTLIMTVDDNGTFSVIIFDPEKLSRQYIYKENLGENWMDREWEFRISVTEPETITINQFQYFQFTELNH